MPDEKPVEIEVTCVITEDDGTDNERIVQVGGNGWQKKVSDVVWEMDLGVAIYFTMVDGQRAEIHKVTPDYGPPYLRTDHDDENTNNLMALPRCPSALPSGR